MPGDAPRAVHCVRVPAVRSVGSPAHARVHFHDDGCHSSASARQARPRKYPSGVLPRPIAAVARVSARSALSSSYNCQAKKPQTIAAAKNGQAARTRSRSIIIAPATAVMLRRIGATNHQMTLRFEPAPPGQHFRLDRSGGEDGDGWIQWHHVMWQFGHGQFKHEP